jgi:hypothetical protein
MLSRQAGRDDVQIRFRLIARIPVAKSTNDEGVR